MRHHDPIPHHSNLPLPTLRKAKWHGFENQTTHGLNCHTSSGTGQSDPGWHTFWNYSQFHKDERFLQNNVHLLQIESRTSRFSYTFIKENPYFGADLLFLPKLVGIIVTCLKTMFICCKIMCRDGFATYQRKEGKTCLRRLTVMNVAVKTKSNACNVSEGHRRH